MNFRNKAIITLFSTSLLVSCGESVANSHKVIRKIPNAKQVDRFADIQVIRYDIEGFDKLTLSQKKLVYYLAQAGLSGRDIIYDQNNEFNIEIRHCLESIVENYKGEKESDNWYNFITYAKRVWFSNGIHHHYGMDKIIPEFSKEFFAELVTSTKSTISKEAISVMFDLNKAMKRKDKNSNVDMITSSANNFYGDGVTQEMTEKFYASKIDVNDATPLERIFFKLLFSIIPYFVEPLTRSGIEDESTI